MLRVYLPYFMQVGTHPLTIRDFSEARAKGETTAEFIETSLNSAHDDLEMFLHRPILEILKSSPDGVKARKLAGVKHEGVHLAQPTDVAAAMKKQQAIFYHIPSGEYRTASQAHRTALIERFVI